VGVVWVSMGECRGWGVGDGWIGWCAGVVGMGGGGEGDGWGGGGVWGWGVGAARTVGGLMGRPSNAHAPRSGVGMRPPCRPHCWSAPRRAVPSWTTLNFGVPVTGKVRSWRDGLGVGDGTCSLDWSHAAALRALCSQQLNSFTCVSPHPHPGLPLKVQVDRRRPTSTA